MSLQEQWQCQVSIDVTELSGYHYHTGIVFNGYINSETQPLVRGGRFDGMQSGSQLAGHQPREATGFSMDVSRLLAHTQLNAPTIVLVDYDAANTVSQEQRQILLQQVESLRQQGYRVTMPLNAADRPTDVTHKLSLIDNQWQLQTLSILDN